jgi:hypothetical protein
MVRNHVVVSRGLPVISSYWAGKMSAEWSQASRDPYLTHVEVAHVLRRPQPFVSEC